MTRIKFSSARGTSNFEKSFSTLIFAGILIVCSVAVGCSSEKPTTPISNNQPPISQAAPALAISPANASTTAEQPPAKPLHRKVVRKAPMTVTYANESSGVSFQYPRKYSLKTGEDADKLVSSDAVPMNFVQPGGIALAVVAVPESAYPKSDLTTAFFNVSVNKTLTADQCVQFLGSQEKSAAPEVAPVQAAPKSSKLMIGDMELQSVETLTTDGNREEESKYYHVFENGGCYEFAIKVATGVETDEGGKHVDRGEIFKRLEKILATVKINPVTAPEVTASTPTAAPATPAQ
jgi:hypothetical protein